MVVLDELEQDVRSGSCSIESYCEKIARFFSVRKHEIALFTLQHSVLRFLHPVELQNAGNIPLTSTSQAAKTAVCKRAEILNNFLAVRHSSVFETVRMSSATEGDSQTIQKMISSPLVGPEGKVVGVLQISRKGESPVSAGPDFTLEHLRQAEQIARVTAKLMPLLLESEAAAADARP